MVKFTAVRKLYAFIKETRIQWVLFGEHVIYRIPFIFFPFDSL